MTQARTLNGLRVVAIAAWLLTAGLWAAPAAAQNSPNQSDNTGTNVGDVSSPNQSDNTGTNVGDIPAPTGLVDGSGEIIVNLEDFDLISGIVRDPSNGEAIARDISVALDEAYAQCQASIAQAADRPRRFARGASPAVDCTSVACDRFNQLVEETRRFLVVQTEIREQIQLRSGSRLW